MARKLTTKQQRFVDLYDGNGTQTARKAGYQGTDNTLAQAARELLRNPHIADAIKNRERKTVAPQITIREKLQTFWQSVMEDEDASMMDRLTASSNLAKSEGVFLKKVELSGKVSVLEDVVAGDADDDTAKS